MVKGYMYILKCFDDTYYTGSTKNLEQRLWQHKTAQGANHTKVRLPVELIYTEYYERIYEAFAREKQIQKWSKKKKEALISNNINELISLSKCRCLSLSKAKL
jgi:putative endonuclease